VSEDFRSITPRCSRVILVEAGTRLLPSFPKELSAKAEQSLRQLGVEVRLGAPVKEIGDGHVYLDRKLVFASTVVWAAGVQASPAAEWLRADHDSNGRVIVDADLRVPGHSSTFAIGDTARAIDTNGAPTPAVAPAAKQQGRYAADVILGRARRPFRYRDFGNFATIGRNKAVIVMGSFKLSGFLAWAIWSAAHIWFLIGFRSRLSVTIAWLWNYLTFRRSARLITGEIAFPTPKPLRPRSLERKSA
jgi:NADH dehydrogenase